MPDGSIDLILTDPPYGTTNCAWDKAAPDWPILWPEMWRVLRPNGAAIICSQQPAATDLITAAREHYRHSIVWDKPAATGHLNAYRAPLRAHELLLVFCRCAPSYTAISIPEQAGKPYHWASRRSKGSHYNPSRPDVAGAGSPDGSRLLRDVIRLGLEPGERGLHPTRKPRRLMQYMLRAYTGPGELVCDPYCGSGTVAEACIMEGRYCIAGDLSPDYVALARQRAELMRERASQGHLDL